MNSREEIKAVLSFLYLKQQLFGIRQSLVEDISAFRQRKRETGGW